MPLTKLKIFGRIKKVSMQTNKLIISSITKGLIIAGVLVFFHILASHKGSPHTKAETFKVASHEDIPSQSHQEDETKFVMASYSINVAMNLEIVREMLILLIVFLNVNTDIKIFYFDIPIPLGKHFRILFSSVISPNAP